jgi:hypothetical protein
MIPLGSAVGEAVVERMMTLRLRGLVRAGREAERERRLAEKLNALRRAGLFGLPGVAAPPAPPPEVAGHDAAGNVQRSLGRTLAPSRVL